MELSKEEVKAILRMRRMPGASELQSVVQRLWDDANLEYINKRASEKNRLSTRVLRDAFDILFNRSF